MLNVLLIISSIISIIGATPLIGGKDVEDVEIIKKTRNGSMDNGQNLYPYMVHISIYKIISINSTHKKSIKNICGGSILAEYAVLTAAHCIVKEPNEVEQYVTILAGIVNTELEKTKRRKIRVDQIIPHSMYIDSCEITKDKKIFCFNDIAILGLQHDLVFGTNVNKAILNEDLKHLTNKKGLILGWGVDDSNKISKVLKSGVMSVISKTECRNHYRKEVHIFEQMICLLSDKKTTTICMGDSGGPFVVNGIIYGIASFNTVIEKNNITYCDPTEPAIFTDVSMYSAWIKKTLNTIKLKRKKSIV